jgi:hypothetical protein
MAAAATRWGGARRGEVEGKGGLDESEDSEGDGDGRRGAAG